MSPLSLYWSDEANGSRRGPVERTNFNASGQDVVAMMASDAPEAVRRCLIVTIVAVVIVET